MELGMFEKEVRHGLLHNIPTVTQLKQVRVFWFWLSVVITHFPCTFNLQVLVMVGV